MECLLQDGPQDPSLDKESIQDAGNSPQDPASDEECIEDSGDVEPPLSTQMDDQPEVTYAPRL